MKAVARKINNFTPIDNKGVVEGNYYLDRFGNVVQFNGMPTLVNLPYAVSVDIDKTNDVCTMHISEMEKCVNQLSKSMEKCDDLIKKAKYQGYVEAFNYIIKYNSYIDPWADFIQDIEEQEFMDWLW